MFVHNGTDTTIYCSCHNHKVPGQYDQRNVFYVRPYQCIVHACAFLNGCLQSLKVCELGLSLVTRHVVVIEWRFGFFSVYFV